MNAAPPPAQWPAITDADTCRAVAALLSDPKRKLTPGPERRHLLSGLALCGVCDAPVWCTATAKDGRRRLVYRCSKAVRGHVARDVAALDEQITHLAVARLSMPDARKLVMPKTGNGVAALRRERTAIEALMRESNDLRRRKLLTAAEFAEDRAEHLARLEQLDARIAAAEEADVIAPLLDDPAAAWQTRDLDQRRAVIDALMTIRIMPAAKGRPKGWRKGQRYFDLDSIQIEWKRGTDNSR